MTIRYVLHLYRDRHWLYDLRNGIFCLMLWGWLDMVDLVDCEWFTPGDEECVVEGVDYVSFELTHHFDVRTNVDIITVN